MLPTIILYMINFPNIGSASAGLKKSKWRDEFSCMTSTNYIVHIKYSAFNHTAGRGGGLTRS